jgi:hypothetical protein
MAIETIADALRLLREKDIVTKGDIRRIGMLMVEISGSIKLFGAYAIIAEELGYTNRTILCRALKAGGGSVEHRRKDKHPLTTF